jgi:hypothetical protein
MNKRQEDFKQASQSFEIQVISNPWTLFEKGCEHGYQYAVEKACKFLKEKEFGDWIEQEASSFIEDFRKAMQ